MIDGELSSIGSAIGAFKTISYQNVFLAEWDAVFIEGPDQLDEPHDGRDFHDKPFGPSNRFSGFLKDLDLTLCDETHGPSPVDHIQERKVRIQEDTLGHRQPLTGRFPKKRNTPRSGRLIA